MTFKFTLESQLEEGRFTFVTVEDCKDMDDAINHNQVIPLAKSYLESEVN